MKFGGAKGALASLMAVPSTKESNVYYQINRREPQVSQSPSTKVSRQPGGSGKIKKTEEDVNDSDDKAIKDAHRREL